MAHNNHLQPQPPPPPPPSPGASSEVSFVLAILAGYVSFFTGYISTTTGREAMAAAAKTRYLPPIDVFIFSMLAAISLYAFAAANPNSSFPNLEKFSLMFVVLASSSIADITLYSRQLVWVVYVPTVVLWVLLVYKAITISSVFSVFIAPFVRRVFNDLVSKVHALWILVCERLAGSGDMV